MKKELISQCLFYKGEKKCNYEDEDSMRPLYWEYEKVWIKWELDENSKLTDGLLYLERACPYAAKDNPDVPFGLQSIFVNRIEHMGRELITRFALRNFIKQYKQAAQ